MTLAQIELSTFYEEMVITLDSCLITLEYEYDQEYSEEFEVITLEPQESTAFEVIPDCLLPRGSQELARHWFVGALSHEPGSLDKELEHALGHFEDGVVVKPVTLVKVLH